MYYGPKIIIATGIEMDEIESKEKLGIILNIPLALTNALGSAVAVLVIDKMGRRYIMLRTLPGVFLACITTSVSMYLCNYQTGTAQTVGNYVALVSLVVYLGFF